MDKITSCIKVKELNDFEHNILKAHSEGLSGDTKQEKLSEFINKYSIDLRIFFCEKICGLSHKCEVYKNLKDTTKRNI
jgi:hypothetical protein